MLFDGAARRALEIAEEARRDAKENRRLHDAHERECLVLRQKIDDFMGNTDDFLVTLKSTLRWIVLSVIGGAITMFGWAASQVVHIHVG